MEKQTNQPTFKTLTPRDPDYMGYLMGSFSKVERAIPQASLNLQSINELVTFEIRKIDQLEPAPTWKKLWLLLKPQTWLTVLVPVIMMSNLEPQLVLGFALKLSLVLVLLMIFANWQADLADHIEGWDRLHNGKAKSVLQKGWFTGSQIQNWSRVVLALAAFWGLPLLKQFPWVLLPYALAALSLLLLLPRWWRKSLWPGFSSFCIFALAGPLLTVGIDLSFDGQFSVSSLFIGFAWGLWMSFIRQQKIYTKQWHLHQKQPPFFVLGLGFDRSKSLMRLLIPGVPLAMMVSFFFVKGGAAWFFPLLVVHSSFVFFELQMNEKVQSSIGSSLTSLQKVFNWHHYFIALMMIIGAIVWKSTNW
ncbi:MAG: hypothetical protein RJB66_2498 [Pseudomonadota bacterium]|jgi:hypothetical protein